MMLPALLMFWDGLPLASLGFVVFLIKINKLSLIRSKTRNSFVFAEIQCSRVRWIEESYVPGVSLLSGALKVKVWYLGTIK